MTGPKVGHISFSMQCEDVIDHLLKCKECMDFVVEAVTKANCARAGSVSSRAKALSSKINGRFGGRPPKKKD